MNLSYQKLNNFQTNIDHRLINMSGRTPSFIVVGLVIIMFLLGLFYMSCSSKNTELRLSLEQFEERIRSLTIKNSDSDKKYENLNSRKHELEEEKLNIQRQMEKKDSEVNDLNTKLNEKIAALQSLSSDKKVLEEQLKDYKSLSETLASKNSLIERLQQQINDRKQSENDELTQLKREIEILKNNRSPQNNQLPSNNEQPNAAFINPPQRFQPLLSINQTTKSSSSFVQDPLNKLNNLTKEVEAQIVPVALDIKDKVLSAFGINTNLSTSTILNQQQDINNDKNQQQINQNVPAPPLANNAQRQQQPDHVESAQAAPQVVRDNQAAVDNSQYQNRLQQSFNNSIADNKNMKLSDMNENDDEDQLDLDRLQQNMKPIKQDNFENNNQPIDAPSLVRSSKKNYRKDQLQRFRKNRKSIQQEQKLDNGEELDGNYNNEEYRQIRKRSVL